MSLAWREREHHTETGEQSQAHLGTAVCCAAPRPVHHHAAPPTYPTLPSLLSQGPLTMPSPMPSSSLTHSTTWTPTPPHTRHAGGRGGGHGAGDFAKATQAMTIRREQGHPRQPRVSNPQTFEETRESGVNKQGIREKIKLGRGDGDPERSGAWQPSHQSAVGSMLGERCQGKRA